MDPLTLAAGAVIATLGGEAVKTLAVPLEAWRQHQTSRIVARLDRVRAAAEHAAADRPLQPSDRTAFKAFAEAAVTENELMADYLGGVIAASGPDDDSGVPMVALLGRMSALQLRFHYLIYRSARELWPPGAAINLYSQKANPVVEFPRAALIQGTGVIDIGLETASTLYALTREGLIADHWTYGPPAGDDSADFSAVVQTSALGAEVYLWGHGALSVRVT